MKPLTLIFALTLAASVTFGQSNPKYYEINVKYMASDKCWHENALYREQISGYPYWGDIVKSFKLYVKPYKLIEKSFEITSMKSSTKEIYKAHQNTKFKPCSDTHFDFTNLNTTSTLSSCDTCHINFIQATANWTYSTLTVRNLNKEWLNVSAPDSTHTYTVTVTFSKSVHFINDTTFTFKLKQ